MQCRMDDEPKVDGPTDERPEIEKAVVNKRLLNQVRMIYVATSLSLFDDLCYKDSS